MSRFAYISKIQHFNVYDGNGLRTLVFFQGCGLRCKWCENPELISVEPVELYDDSLCTGCGKCDDGCVFLARQMSARKWSVDEVYKEAVKDRVFYGREGGVTLSGGEPLLQADFAATLLKKLKQVGIHTAIETAGYVPWSAIEIVRPLTDTFLFDIKVVSHDIRKEWVGAADDRMLKNLLMLSRVHNHIVARIPLIPGVNASGDEFNAILDYIERCHSVRYIHILPFHQMGAKKYKMTGMQNVIRNATEVCAFEWEGSRLFLSHLHPYNRTRSLHGLRISKI